MPFIILIITSAVLFIWYNWGRNRARSSLSQHLDPFFYRLFKKLPCQWVPVEKITGGLNQFRCQNCGVTAYSTSGKGPQECKRSLRGGL